jgi:mono/diheme cytochrome c family protein
MRILFPSATAIAMVLALAFSLASAADEAKPKHSIKEVMKAAHKDGLLKKVASGQGTKEDAQHLLELYKALGDNKPPKGDHESWKAKTLAIIEAAQEVVDGKPGAGERLTKAANCAECHKVHKPS